MTHDEFLSKLNDSEAAARKSNLDEAEQLVKEAQAYLEALPAGQETQEYYKMKSAVLLKLSNIYRRRGRLQKALEYVFEAHPLTILAKDETAEAKILQSIGNIYRFMNEFQKSIEYLLKALAMHERLDNKEEMSDVLGHIGDTYSKMNEFPNAIEYMKRALALQEELNLRRNSAFVLGNMGLIYCNMADYIHSLEYMMQALALHEEFESFEEQGDVLGNIGIVYYYIHDYPLALEYMGRSLEIHEKLGMKSKVASKYQNLGNVLYSMKEFSKALENMDHALAICKELGIPSKAGGVLNSIASVYIELGEYQRALEYLEESLEVYTQTNMRKEIASTNSIIGLIYADKKFEGYDADKAEELLLGAIEQFEEMGALASNMEVIKNLAVLYEQIDKWEEANHYNKKYNALEREVFSAEVQKQTEKFAFERKISEEQAQRRATEELLHNILPKTIANRMMEKKATISDYFENVSIFFSDIVDFTTLSSKISPQQLVEGLNAIFSEFDRIAIKHGLEKIKTIGDSYMAVCGIPEPCENHAERVALFALEVTEAIKNFTFTEDKITVVNRIGLHCGSVVAGVIGEDKFAYDLWGDSVNTASRMESHGEPGRIQVSEDFMRATEETVNRSEMEHKRILKFTERGELEIKGKGKMKTYFLERNL